MSDPPPVERRIRFQDLASLQIGYFTVNARGTQGSIDWKWLGKQPLAVKMNGKTREGIILRPKDPPRQKR